MSALLGWSIALVSYVAITYFLFLNASYLITSLLAFRAIRRYVRGLRSLDVADFLMSDAAPPVTVIMPAYNEEPTCVASARALLSLNYGNYEIIVISDGSKDGTMARMTEAFDLKPTARLATADIQTAAVREVYQSRQHPNLWVIDKENGGKADTLNTGLNYSTAPLFCAMDADSLLERDALARIVRPFLEDVETIAAGGVIRIANGCRIENGLVTEVRLPRTLIPAFQALEYLRAFLAGRLGWSAIEATLIVSGAFGLFRRSIVVDAGGYATRFTTGHTVGEDMELVVRLHRHCRERKIPYRISFVPDPVAWTECPETLKQLGRQRDRWQRGMAESLMRHRAMFFRPRYGRIGMVAFPYFLLFETFGPFIEAAGYVAFALSIATGRASWPLIAAFLAVSVMFGMVISIVAVGLEELGFRRYPRARDLVRLFGLAVVENLGYRQLNSWWRFKGMVSAIRRKGDWGEMKRTGFASPSTPAR